MPEEPPAGPIQTNSKRGGEKAHSLFTKNDEEPGNRDAVWSLDPTQEPDVFKENLAQVKKHLTHHYEKLLQKPHQR